MKNAATFTIKGAWTNMVSRKSAGELGVETLYHYEPFNRTYLSATLREQKIHCSNPANLNDPWDCHPWFDSRSLDAEDVLRQVIEYHHGQARLAGSAPLSPDLNKEWLRVLRGNPQERRKLMESLSKTALHKMLAQRRIYCLASDADSTLMWSHYAEKHRGICLEFDVDNDLFRKAKQVSGATIKRPALASCLKTLQPGDTLTVWKLDRLGRSLRDLIPNRGRCGLYGDTRILLGSGAGHTSAHSALGPFFDRSILFGSLNNLAGETRKDRSQLRQKYVHRPHLIETK